MQNDAYLMKSFIAEAITQWDISLMKRLQTKDQLEKRIIIDQSSKIIYLDNELDIFYDMFKPSSSSIWYHYTRFNTLLDILKSNKLRFSGVAGLNDAKEMRSKSDVFGKKIKNPFSDYRMKIINNRYVFCMSKRGDDLNQWRLYGDDGKGICLGFK